MSLLPDKGFHRRALLASGISIRANRVGAHLCRHDEGLRKVHNEWLKRTAGTFYNCFFALDKVQDIHGPLCLMRHNPGEPVSPGLNEFQFVQASTFFPPAIACPNPRTTHTEALLMIMVY